MSDRMTVGGNGSQNSRFGSIRHSGVMVQYVWYGGNSLRCNVGNIYVLNHEGEPMDITHTSNVHILHKSHAGECNLMME